MTIISAPAANAAGLDLIRRVVEEINRGRSGGRVVSRCAEALAI